MMGALLVRSLLSALVFSALCSPLVCAQPAAGQPVQTQRTTKFYCSAYFGPNGGENLLFSDIFEGPIHTDIPRLRGEWNKFVKEKYSTSASGGCSSGDKAKEAEGMRSRKKIIETGWKPQTVPVAKQTGP